jgi:hypothetical protein
MIQVAKITKTCEACPAQWEGELVDGTPIYVRYRWGGLTITLNPWTDNREVIVSKDLGEDNDDDEMIKTAPPEWQEGMRSSFEMMRKFSLEHCGTSKLSFDGYMTYEQLKAVTAGEISWPDEEEYRNPEDE